MATQKEQPEVAAEVAGDGTKTSPSPMATLKFAYLSLFIDILGLTIAIPVLPYFQRVLGASDTTSGGIFATYAFASACAQAVTGFLSDKYGRRRMLLLSIFGSALGFLLTGLSNIIAEGLSLDPVLVLFACRFIAGASGNSQPVVAAMIADCTADRPEERNKFYGLVGATIGIGFTVGPGIGAIAMLVFQTFVKDEIMAFACVFFVSSVMCFIGFLFALRKLRETRRQEDDHESAEQKRKDLCRSAVMPLLAVPFLWNYCFVTMQSTFGFVLQDVYISNAKTASTALGVVLFIAGWIIAPVQAGLFKKIAAKFGLVATCTLGAVLLGVGTILVGISSHLEWHLAVTLAFFFLMLIPGFAFTMPSLQALTAEYSPRQSFGAAQGLISSSQMTATVIGPVCACALYEIKPIFAYAVAGSVALTLIVPLFISARVHAVTAGAGCTAEEALPASKPEGDVEAADIHV